MNQDIGPMLDGWPYNSNEVTVRKIIGVDGREKIQMRLDLGVLQMETQGRPDAERPHGYESLLEYHQHRLQRHLRQHGGEDGFWMDEEECGEMKQEAMQYYYRYLSSFHLGDYDDVMRDTPTQLSRLRFSARTRAGRKRPYVAGTVPALCDDDANARPRLYRNRRRRFRRRAQCHRRRH